MASGKLINFKRRQIVDFVQSHGGQIHQYCFQKLLISIIEGEGEGPSKKKKAFRNGGRADDF